MPDMSGESVSIATVAKRILIADDHPLYRDALRAVLPQACPDAELKEAACQDEVLQQVVSDAAFDLIVLDLNLPGAEGYSCLKGLRAAAPLTPVIMVSAVDDPAIMSDAILAGATGYVPKSAPRQVLIDAIRIVLSGGTYLPMEAMIALRVAQPVHAAQASGAKGDQLTSRQRRVLELLGKGKSNKQIASELEISEITVKAHVSSILKKLGVSNRVQAALEAQKADQ
jgi:DNA-binding NarL/FixJ family response regulator